MNSSTNGLRTAVFWVVAEVSPRNAGYGVRSKPIADELTQLGHHVEFIALPDLPNQLDDITARASVVIVAKPADTATILCLRHFKSHGIRVVIDLFDNYFSWSPTLFARAIHWQWLRALECASLVSVSTTFLSSTVRRIAPLQVLHVGDPLPDNPEERAVELHIQKWHDRGTLQCTWFGIPGNPFFHAGLDDLQSWAPVVRRLQQKLGDGQQLQLTVCTNRGPGVDAVLAAMRAHGIPARFEPWTKASCDALLDRTHVVLLPTNTTAFSVSKTHNRCTDALLRRCLVLASPNGPYKDIRSGVFFTVDTLCETLLGADASAALDTIAHGLQGLRESYPTRATALQLAQGLASDPSRQLPAPSSTPKVLLVGQTNQNTVKLSRRLGYLTCCYTGSKKPWNFDFYLEAVDPTVSSVTLTLTPKAHAAILERIDVDCDWFESDRQRCGKIGDRLLTMSTKGDRCTIRDPAFALPTRELAALQRLGSDHPLLLERWTTLNIVFLTELLVSLGFDEFELAHDDAGVWPAFAPLGAPKLADLEQRLRQLWDCSVGNELAWGATETLESAA